MQDSNQLALANRDKAYNQEVASVKNAHQLALKDKDTQHGKIVADLQA